MIVKKETLKAESRRPRLFRTSILWRHLDG